MTWQVILVGVVVFIDPGSLLQLVVALVVAVVALTVRTHAAPYRRKDDNTCATAIELATVFFFVGCIVVRISELVDALSQSDVQRELWAFIDIDISNAVLLLFGCTLGTMMMLVVFTLQHAREAWGSVRLVRRQKSRQLAELPDLNVVSKWHVFISHGALVLSLTTTTSTTTHNPHPHSPTPTPTCLHCPPHSPSCRPTTSPPHPRTPPIDLPTRPAMLVQCGALGKTSLAL